jgi:hypothetical protein
MLAIAFIRWWYGQGWTTLNTNARKRMQRTADSFSVPILIRTLFAPWKRIVATPGSGIDAHLRAMGDNIVSRAVGFSVRLFVLGTAGICMLFLGIFSLIQITLWPLIPVLAVVCVVCGVIL